VGDAQAHNAPLWIVEQSIFTVAARVVIIWLYNNAGKAVPAAILFHSMVNVSDAVFPNYSLPSAPAFVAAFTLVLAGIATFLWGSKTLSQYRFARKRLADAT